MAAKASRKPVTQEIKERRRNYLARQSPPRRRILKVVDGMIRKAEPAATECFSYGIPGFKLNGRPLVWCAAWKNHFSLYPMTAGIRKKFPRELKGLETSTGTIQFPFSGKPPLA